MASITWQINSEYQPLYIDKKERTINEINKNLFYFADRFSPLLALDILFHFLSNFFPAGCETTSNKTLDPN